MATIYISGLVNTETTVPVHKFPIDYYPIDYPFFAVQTQVSGVAYNIAKALMALGDGVVLASFLGNDLQADVVAAQLARDGLDLRHIRRELQQTPASVVLYDREGKRQIYCDLKDIQEKQYPCDEALLAGCDLIAACNINFNRSLLPVARKLGKTIATDLHVFSNLDDDYNRDFLEHAQIVFFSDEALPGDQRAFLWQLSRRFGTEIVVLGRGSRGALLYVRQEDRFYDLPCVPARKVANTVGAGDALFSGFLHFFTKGLSPADALWNAQIFASAKIETNGASQGFISEEEVLQRRSEGKL